MHTFLIIWRKQNQFDVEQVEVDPHTVQGATALKDAINKASQQGTVTQILDCGKSGSV